MSVQHTHRANRTVRNFSCLLKFRTSNSFNRKRQIYENPSISRSQPVSLNLYQTFPSSLGEALWQKPWNYVGSPAKLLTVPCLVITQTSCHKKGDVGRHCACLSKLIVDLLDDEAQNFFRTAIVSRLRFDSELKLTVSRRHRRPGRLEAEILSINFLEIIWTF